MPQTLQEADILRFEERLAACPPLGIDLLYEGEVRPGLLANPLDPRPMATIEASDDDARGQQQTPSQFG